MTQTKEYQLPTSQLTHSGHNLLSYAQKHPIEFGICSIAISAGIATIVVPLAVGFTGSGVGAGTAAAAWQSSIGNVVAGSFFATLQSMTMNGSLFAVGGGLIGAGAVGLAGGMEWARGVDWVKSVDWVQGAEWERWGQAAGLAGSKAWEESEKAAKSVDWGQVAGGAEWAARETAQGTVWAAGEAAKGTQWAAGEAAKGLHRAFTGGWL